MYEPSRLVKTFFIAGFQRYDGALVLDKLKAGKKIKMVRDPKNPYDANAIELHYKGTKLGFVPQSENSLIALMMTYGHKKVFEARIIQVDRKANPWQQVRVGIYVTDARK